MAGILSQAEYIRLAALHVRWLLKSSSLDLSVTRRVGSANCGGKLGGTSHGGLGVLFAAGI